MLIWSLEKTGIFFFLPGFPPQSLQLLYGENCLEIKILSLSVYTFHWFFLLQTKSTRKIREYQLGLVKYLFCSVRCFMNWAIYVTKLIFTINAAVVFIWEILWLKMTHVYLAELFHNKHLLCILDKILKTRFSSFTSVSG